MGGISTNETRNSKAMFLLIGILMLVCAVVAVWLIVSDDDDNKTDEQPTEVSTEEETTDIEDVTGNTHKDNQQERDINPVSEEEYYAEYGEDDERTMFFFDIKLPQTASVSGMPCRVRMFESSSAYPIVVEGTELMEKYPYAEGSRNLIAEGWIEQCIDDSEYYYINDEYPHPRGNYKYFYNYELVNGGYICEAEIDVLNSISGDEALEKLTAEQKKVKYWCIIFEKQFEDYKHSNWIYLNKDCFTKEEALEIADSYIPSWDCDFFIEDYICKGDKLYTLNDEGDIDEGIEPITIEWHDVSSAIKVSSDVEEEMEIEFSWTEFEDNIYIKYGLGTWNDKYWSLKMVYGDADKLIISLKCGINGIVYASYDMNTGKLTNTFGKLSDFMPLSYEAVFTDDATKAAVRTDDELAVYYYDVEAQKAYFIEEQDKDIKKYIEYVTICENKVFIYMGVEGEKRAFVYEYNIATGEIRQNGIGEVRFSLHGGDYYVFLLSGQYVIDLEACNEKGVLEIYNLDTETAISTGIQMSEFKSIAYVDDTMKIVQIKLKDGTYCNIEYTTLFD